MLCLTHSGSTTNVHSLSPSPLTLGNGQGVVATHPSPPSLLLTGSADTQTLFSSPPTPSGRSVGEEAAWPWREAGKRGLGEGAGGISSRARHSRAPAGKNCLQASMTGSPVWPHPSFHPPLPSHQTESGCFWVKCSV